MAGTSSDSAKRNRGAPSPNRGSVDVDIVETSGQQEKRSWKHSRSDRRIDV